MTTYTPIAESKKFIVLDKYTKGNFVYIGIASDEKRRIEKIKTL